MATYPYTGINGAYYDTKFLDSVWEYLHKQALLWAAGVSEPTPSDRLAYQVLRSTTIASARDNKEDSL